MTTAQSLLLAVHCLATAAMVGIIWFVQVVHYPLFAAVGPDAFVAYENENTRLTSWVVGPAMLVEGLAALAIALLGVPGVPGWLAWTGLGLLAVTHASTGLLQVPAHRTLSAGFDPAAARRLVASNWLRTATWSSRGVVAVAMLVAAIGSITPR